MVRVLQDRQVLRWGALLGAGCVMLLVLLHMAWGLCIELGLALAKHEPQWKLGLRFGLYACAWDLLTSPAGAIYCLGTRRPRNPFAPIASAVRAPRLALRAYSEDRRHSNPRGRQLVTRVSIVVLGGAMLLFSMALGLVARHFVRAVF